MRLEQREFGIHLFGDFAITDGDYRTRYGVPALSVVEPGWPGCSKRFGLGGTMRLAAQLTSHFREVLGTKIQMLAPFVHGRISACPAPNADLCVIEMRGGFTHRGSPWRRRLTLPHRKSTIHRSQSERMGAGKGEVDGYAGRIAETFGRSGMSCVIPSPCRRT